jgi:tetratricopeptide (TPR) repeat protein
LQSFKYAIIRPEATRRRRRGAPWPGLLLLATLAGGGWLLAQGHRPDMAGPVRALRAMVERPAVADERGRSVEGLLRQGDVHLSRAEYKAATKLYVQCLQLAPDQLSAWDRAALAAYMQRDARPPAPEDVLPSSEPRVRLLVALAERARGLGLREAAHAWLLKAEALTPDAPRVLAARARLAAGGGDLDQALAAVERALSSSPDEPALHRLRFELRLAHGDVEAGCREALAAVRPLLEREEGGQAAALVAEAYIRQGLSPEDVRRRLADDTPHLRTATRKLVLARAYQHHYTSNPNWFRDAFDRVRGLVEEVRRADSDAVAAERLEAVRIMLEARRARLARFVERSDLDAAVVEAGQAATLASLLPPAERGVPADFQAERGRLLTLLGRPKDAMKAFEAAVRIQPGHRARLELARLEAGIGVTLLSAGQRQHALQHLRRAAALHPEDDGILARYYQAQGPRASTQAVLACARVVREREIGTVFARLTHGLSQARRPAEAGALVALARTLRLPPGRLAELRAEAARAAGKPAEARRSLLQAIEHAPSSSLWLRLASVEAAAGRDVRVPGAQRRRHLADALDATRHAVAFAPAGPAFDQLVRLHTELAGAHLTAGDAVRAEHYAAGAAVLAPHDPTVAIVLADARLARSQWAEARDACLAGLRGLGRAVDPRHASLRLRLGRALRRLEQPAEAIAALAVGVSDAAAPAPRQAAELWYELAFAHAAADQREEALSAARQYVRLAQHDPRGQARGPEVKHLAASLAPTP